MNIVVAHEAIDGAGGVETYLAAIVPALQARGHRIAVLYHHGCPQRRALMTRDGRQWTSPASMDTVALGGFGGGR